MRTDAHGPSSDDVDPLLEGLRLLVETQAAREAELQGRLAREKRVREALEERLLALRNELDEVTGWSHAQSERLDEIQGSFSWTLADGCARLVRRIVPPDSLVGRAGRLGRRAARKARQGPRAVARAVLRRLPGGLGRDLGRPAPAPAARLHRPDPDAPPRHGVGGLVSVVLPVYNQADLLPAAIESVLGQTYPDIELIVVNDGSSDDVERVLAAYHGRPGVRLLTQANQKLPKALSNGFDLARGAFWTWTSADNLMHPEQLARQVAFLRANPDAAMVYADYLAIDDRGEPLRDPTWRAHNRQPGSNEVHLPRSTDELNTVHDNFIGPCFLYRAWVGRVIGEYDPNLGNEDYDYWMRINDLFRIEHLGTDEPLYSYRVHDNSLSGRAVELRIVEKGRKLMGYEEGRAAFYREPWTIVVDRESADRLGRSRFAPHRLLVWEDGAFPAADGKTLALVGPAGLERLAGSEAPEGLPVAAWFGTDAEAPYEARRDLRELRAAAFAIDPATADRLAVLGVESFQVGRADDVVGLALRWAKSRTFYEATRPANLRRREPPRGFVPAGRRLRVVVQVDDFTQGGLEQVALGLAAALDPRRFQTVLLVLGKQGEAVRRARSAGIRVVTLPETDRAAHYRRFLADERVDLVNAHYSLFGAEVAAGMGIPFVQVVQNTYVWLAPEEVEAYRAADRHTACYVCVSDEVARYCDVRLGLSASRMVVVPNGVPVRRFESVTRGEGELARRALGLDRDDFVFLNVASIHATKAQVPAVQALGQVVSTHPRARLVLLGRALDDDYLAELKAEIGRLGLEDAVVLAGPTSDPAPSYRMADAFLLPSYWEGWSLALNEALAAGLPVVATDVGAAADLVTPGLGRLVRPPCHPITRLDGSNHMAVAFGRDERFVAELAEAMRSVCEARPGRVVPPAHLRARIDQERVHDQYAELFVWLAQGGHPESARVWTRPDPAAVPAHPAGQAGDGARAA